MNASKKTVEWWSDAQFACLVIYKQFVDLYTKKDVRNLTNVANPAYPDSTLEASLSYPINVTCHGWNTPTQKIKDDVVIWTLGRFMDKKSYLHQNDGYVML